MFCLILPSIQMKTFDTLLKLNVWRISRYMNIAPSCHILPLITKNCLFCHPHFLPDQSVLLTAYLILKFIISQGMSMPQFLILTSNPWHIESRGGLRKHIFFV